MMQRLVVVVVEEEEEKEEGGGRGGRRRRRPARILESLCVDTHLTHTHTQGISEDGGLQLSDEDMAVLKEYMEERKRSKGEL